MKFDSNRAWREASASASANREVLLAVAGVFFLLPGLASVLFLSDFQADMMANFGNPAAAERIMKGMTGPVFYYVDDCHKTHADLKAKGVEITEEPTERFYGIDMGARDPFGNHLRITEPVENMQVPAEFANNSQA